MGRFENRTETTAQRQGRKGAASGGKYERVDHRGSSELQEPNCHTVDIVCKEPACHTADGAPRGPPPDRPDVRKLQLRPAIADLTFDLQILLFSCEFCRHRRFHVVEQTKERRRASGASEKRKRSEGERDWRSSRIRRRGKLKRIGSVRAVWTDLESGTGWTSWAVDSVPGGLKSNRRPGRVRRPGRLTHPAQALKLPVERTPLALLKQSWQ